MPRHSVLLAIFLTCLVLRTAGSVRETHADFRVDSLILTRTNGPVSVVEFEMPAVLFKRIQSIKGQKISLKNTSMRFEGNPVAVNEVHLHGNTTLNYERKSYSVDTDDKVKFCEKGCKPMDAFYLISLTMDKNYFHNRLCFDLLSGLNLFHLQYKFAEVKINGVSQGIYLVLQRPQDWAKKTADSPFILRRGPDHSIAKEKVKKDLAKDSVKYFRHQFQEIYKVIHAFSGEVLYTKLDELMHLDDYLRWMAFNYIVKNGDYSDELYFYIDPSTMKYRIVPWDYDDVFKKEPHEGLSVWKSRMDPSSKVFSSEDDLDYAIARDPYLYKRYLGHLAEVMRELDADRIETVLDSIFSDLAPLYETPGVLEASASDGYTTSLERLRDELATVNQYFLFARTILLKGN